MAQDSAESESGEALTQEDLQQMLEEYEAAYAEAPKSLEKKETAPLLTENGTGDPRFSGVAEDENGRPYSYFVKASADEPVSVQVKYLGDTENASDQALWSDYTPASQYVPEELGTEEKIKSAVGISYEEAKKTADEKAASVTLLLSFQKYQPLDFLPYSEISRVLRQFLHCCSLAKSGKEHPSPFW